MSLARPMTGGGHLACALLALLSVLRAREKGARALGDASPLVSIGGFNKVVMSKNQTHDASQDALCTAPSLNVAYERLLKSVSMSLRFGFSGHHQSTTKTRHVFTVCLPCRLDVLNQSSWHKGQF